MPKGGHSYEAEVAPAVLGFVLCLFGLLASGTLVYMFALMILGVSLQLLGIAMILARKD